MRKAAEEHGVQRLSDPTGWSEDEAFLRMGLFGGFASTPYQPSELGGSHIIRQVPRYEADAKSEEKGCTKHKTASSSHTPGIVLRITPYDTVNHISSVN